MIEEIMITALVLLIITELTLIYFLRALKDQMEFLRAEMKNYFLKFLYIERLNEV